jgi:hypothetical protein
MWGKKPEMSRLLSDLFQASATLIPTILVVAGIVFLLLSIAGHLAGRIAVPPERQRQAAIMGGLLVVVGLTLHVAPLLSSPSTSPEVPPVPRSEPPAGKTPSSPTPETLPSSPSSPPASDPTTQLYKVESLPSLDARVTALRFFAGDCYKVPRAPQRKYTRRFSTGRRELGCPTPSIQKLLWNIHRLSDASISPSRPFIRAKIQEFSTRERKEPTSL